MTNIPSKFDHLFKILIIGESGVGKTCFLLRYAENSFVANHLLTIGIDFKIKIHQGVIKNGITCLFTNGVHIIDAKLLPANWDGGNGFSQDVISLNSEDEIIVIER